MTDATAVLRALDKRDHIDEAGIIDLLTVGRKDASGDFTPGCGLTNGQAFMLLALLNRVDASFNPEHKLARCIVRRFHLIALLEGRIVEAASGKTAWDVLLELRPPNIAVALDQIADALGMAA